MIFFKSGWGQIWLNLDCKSGWGRMFLSCRPDATWYRGRPWPRPHCVGTQPPTFQPMSIVAKWLDGSSCHLVWR